MFEFVLVAWCSPLSVVLPSSSTQQSELPSLFAKAYPDKSPAPTSITLWGVELSTTPNAKASVILAKFLRARSLNVQQAADMLVATLKWRDEFKIDEIMQEKFDPEVFGKLGVVYGKDKEGHPVTYNLYGAVKDLKAVFGDVQKFLRCVGERTGLLWTTLMAGSLRKVARAVHGGEHQVARL